MESAALWAKSAIPFLFLVLFAGAMPRLPTIAVFTPSRGDPFKYHGVTDLGNGAGNYGENTESMTVNGVENMITAIGAIVSANYGYAYNWSNCSGNIENGQKSGTFTFSSTRFHYFNVTDDQIGYMNHSVCSAMNNALPVGSTFSILNTQLTILSKNEIFYRQTNQPVMVDSS